MCLPLIFGMRLFWEHLTRAYHAHPHTHSKWEFIFIMNLPLIGLSPNSYTVVVALQHLAVSLMLFLLQTTSKS